jgi:hypothetical protein
MIPQKDEKPFHNAEGTFRSDKTPCRVLRGTRISKWIISTLEQFEPDILSFGKMIPAGIDSHTMSGIRLMASSENPSMEGIEHAEDRRFFKTFQSKHQNAAPLR